MGSCIHHNHNHKMHDEVGGWVRKGSDRGITGPHTVSRAHSHLSLARIRAAAELELCILSLYLPGVGGVKMNCIPACGPLA